MSNQGQTGPVRALLVEDNPADARLLRAAVFDGVESEFQIEHVERLNDAIRRLEAGKEKFDVVLLDLNLPDSTGMETVRWAVAAARQAPIIVLTGMDSDTLGMEAVQYGAQDYLTKGQIDRRVMSRAIRYAIERKRFEVDLIAANETLEQRVHDRTAELERSVTMLGEQVADRLETERTLRESESRFRLLLEALPDVFWMYSPEQERVVLCNSAFERVWGLSRETLDAHPRAWLAVVHADDRARVDQAVQDLLAAARAGTMVCVALDFRLSRQDGSTVGLRERIFPIYGQRHELLYLCGVAELLAAEPARVVVPPQTVGQHQAT
ncbi:MAG: response regulator [Phycisphaerae bacterium]|nr:response regulator [Phycisphaerae bacterium]